MKKIFCSKIITASVFIFLLLFLPQKIEAAPTSITEKDVSGMKRIGFISNVTKYTKSGGSGESGSQVEQHIYYNPSGSGTRKLIWFQHGDGSQTPRLACENRFYAAKILTADPNFVIFCPEMNHSHGTGMSGPEKANWSIHYTEFFKDLYNDFITAASSKGLTVSKDIIFASHSQGGPATSHITTQPNSFPFIKVIKIIRFDSCYGNQCVDEANIPVDKRGPLITFASTVCPTDPKEYCNATSNQSATIKKEIYKKANVKSYTVNASNHTQVPQRCTMAILGQENCEGKAVAAGGSTTEIAGSGGTAVSSVTAPGGDVLGGIATFDEIQLILQKPKLQVRLPGVNFSDIKEVDEGGTKFLFIPFLGEYLAAGYKYAIVIASIFATAMILNAGFTLLMAAGSSEKVTYAKKRIGEALIGLLLAVGSYVFLYTINPELVNFRNLRVMAIRGIPLDGVDYSTGQFSDASLPVPMVAGSATELQAEIDKYKSQGCGKQLVQIANAFANKVVCNGPCNCAAFTSRVLKLSGCADNMISSGAQELRKRLKNAGWVEVKRSGLTPSGVQPGDIVFAVHGDTASHVEIAADDKGGSIGSNTDMTACWLGKEKEILKKCGPYYPVGYYAGRDKKDKKTLSGEGQALLQKYGYTITGSWVDVKREYSACIASFGVCPPWGDPAFYGSSCGYCDLMSTIGGTEKKFATQDPSGPVDGGCQTRQCVQFSKEIKWTHFIINPNK